MKFLFATTNASKLSEVIGIAGGLGITVEGIGESGSGSSPPIVPETGISYYENALQKARAYAAWSGLACIADDAGLEVDALNGLPGVYTARFGFDRLRDSILADVRYKASFRCCVCFCDAAGRTVAVEAVLGGAVCFPAGSSQPLSAVPYSHYFTPEGESLSLAELTQRGGYPSHRVRALRTLLQVLEVRPHAIGRG